MVNNRRALTDAHSLIGIESRPTQMLHSVFQAGIPHIICGNPGTAKSQLTLRLIADITTGKAWPEGRMEHGQCVLLHRHEDDEGGVIRPRLELAEADISQLTVMSNRIDPYTKRPARRIDLVRDEELIRDEIDSMGNVKLIVLDPLAAFVSNIRNAPAVEKAGGVLRDLAKDYNCAIIGLVHFTKDEETMIGSHELEILARRIYYAEILGNDTFTLRPHKVSHDELYGLQYRLKQGYVRGIKTSMVVLDKELVKFEREHDERFGEKIEAQTHVTSMLAEGPAPGKMIIQRGRDNGIGKNAIMRAKRDLQIVVFKEEGKWNGIWLWRLKDRP